MVLPSFHLRCVDLLVDGIARQQALVGAHRMHPAVLQDDDLVGVHHGGDALGDDELGHIPQLRQSGADLPLSGGVHGAGGVVENQDFRPLEQGTGDAQPLLLPAGDVHAPLAQVGVQALWHPLQKFGGAGHPAGRPQLLVARVRFPPPQILPHGAGEENVLLEHDAHRVPQSPEIVLPHIPAAHPDRPLGGVVQPGNELHQGSLGRASTAQDAQKSNNTHFPFKEDKAKDFPSTSGKLISGTLTPTATFLIKSRR